MTDQLRTARHAAPVGNPSAREAPAGDGPPADAPVAPEPPEDEVIIREVTEPGDPAIAAAERLYESTLPADERIPWAWIERSATNGRGGRTGDWLPDLLVAETAAGVIGYVYGSLIPRFGGYGCYLGVDPTARSRGLGTRLVRAFITSLGAEAVRQRVPLPFVLWESRRPAADASAAERAMWLSRLRVFDRCGAFGIDGLEVVTPNYSSRSGDPVPLSLFLVPVETPAEDFDQAALREVVAGLLEWVYGRGPGDAFFDASLPAAARPRLVPTTEMIL